jgi:protoporphyrinogen IX oxidase
MTGLTGMLGAAYPWVLAAHVTFVIFWVAGLLILPRLFVYHHESAAGSAEDRAWIERERRTRTVILTPAMLAVWLLGLLLAFHVGAFAQGWFHAKLLLVIALTAYQGWLGLYARRLAAGKRSLGNRSLRIVNELPGVAAAVIVVLVIVRPF